MGVTAGTVSITATEAEFFTDPKGATAVMIRAGGVGVEINVPGLHAAGEYLPLPNGETIVVRMEHNGIRKITGKSGGSVSITFGVLEKRTSSQ